MTPDPSPSPAPLTAGWQPGPPPLDRPGRWVFETEGLMSGTVTAYVVTVTEDLEVGCACSGFGNAGRSAFIRTKAVRHYGPIPDLPPG